LTLQFGVLSPKHQFFLHISVSVYVCVCRCMCVTSTLRDDMLTVSENITSLVTNTLINIFRNQFLTIYCYEVNSKHTVCILPDRVIRNTGAMMYRISTKHNYKN